MTPANNKNVYDFSDISDLPEAIAKRVAVENKSVAATAWAKIVIDGAKHGMPNMEINQIIAVATRLGIEVPTAQTVRGYLNKAVENGLLVKPTRQTYAGANLRSKAEAIGLGEADPVVTGEVNDAPVDNADPLAGL